MTSKFGALQAGATINTFKSFSPCNHCRLSYPSARIRDLCCCTAKSWTEFFEFMQLRVFKRVLKSLSLAKELLALWRHPVLICRWRAV
jgi:hypothetical protein